MAVDRFFAQSKKDFSNINAALQMKGEPPFPFDEVKTKWDYKHIDAPTLLQTLQGWESGIEKINPDDYSELPDPQKRPGVVVDHANTVADAKGDLLARKFPPVLRALQEMVNKMKGPAFIIKPSPPIEETIWPTTPKPPKPTGERVPIKLDYLSPHPPAGLYSSQEPDFLSMMAVTTKRRRRRSSKLKRKSSGRKRRSSGRRRRSSGKRRRSSGRRRK